MSMLSDQQVNILAKGGRLVAYLILINHPEGLSQKSLIVITGISDKTMAAALAFLELEHLAQHSMSADGIMKWFCTLGLDASSLEGGGRRISDSTTTIKDITINKDNENNNRGRKFSDPPTLLSADLGGKTQDDWDAIWEELSKASVFRNEYTVSIAKLKHVTPAYVKVLREAFRSRGKGGGQWAGLFVKTLAAEPVEGDKASSIDDKVAEFLNPRVKA